MHTKNWNIWSCVINAINKTTFLVGAGLLTMSLAFPSNAALLLVAGAGSGGAPAAVAGALSLAALPFVISKKKRRWIALVDPVNIETFQLDLSYDPTRMEYIGVQYIYPYISDGPRGPDLNTLGLVQDIRGRVSIPTPPPGEVDIFGVEFEDLDPESDIPSYFTVFASNNDFIRALDVTTGVQVMADSTNIVPTTASTHISTVIPEPSTSTLIGIGILGMLTFCWRSKRLIRSNQENDPTA